MYLRIFLFLLFTSDLLAEATLLSRAANTFRDRVGSRRKKKPVGDILDDGGWPKYFHEPGGSELANHYDSRYEHGILSYEDKQDTQVHMMRAYLDFFRKNRMETWLAHGTLLGWWWNGKVRQRHTLAHSTLILASKDVTVGLGHRYPGFNADAQLSSLTF